MAIATLLGMCIAKTPLWVPAKPMTPVILSVRGKLLVIGSPFTEISIITIVENISFAHSMIFSVISTRYSFISYII
jgi:hypothetical protein